MVWRSLGDQKDSTPPILDPGSCLGGLLLDSGKWIIFKTGRLRLESITGNLTVDILQFKHYYFCIPPNKRKEFVRDFRKSEEK